MSDGLLSTKEVAKRWNVRPRKVTEAVGRGDLKAIRFNCRCWRYHPDDVLEAERRLRER